MSREIHSSLPSTVVKQKGYCELTQDFVEQELRVDLVLTRIESLHLSGDPRGTQGKLRHLKQLLFSC